MRIQRPSRRQLAIVVGGIAVLAATGLIAWGFGQQVTVAQRMKAEEARLEQAVATEQARHDELTALAEAVRTDAYVERWARVDAKMTRAGEVLVVPVTGTDEGLEETVEPAPVPEPETPSFWVAWWQALFGASSRQEGNP